MSALDYYEFPFHEPSNDEFILQIMEKQRQKKIQLLSKVIGVTLAESLSKVLASAYDNGCQDAETIMDAVGLDQLDLYAFDGDVVRFKENYERGQYDMPFDWRDYE